VTTASPFRTGATATDKAGYLIAKRMPNNDVKTYVWYGADQVKYDNEMRK